MKTGMGTNALKSAVEVSSRVRTREGAAKVNEMESAMVKHKIEC